MSEHSVPTEPVDGDGAKGNQLTENRNQDPDPTPAVDSPFTEFQNVQEEPLTPKKVPVMPERKPEVSPNERYNHIPVPPNEDDPNVGTDYLPLQEDDRQESGIGTLHSPSRDRN